MTQQPFYPQYPGQPMQQPQQAYPPQAYPAQAPPQQFGGYPPQAPMGQPAQPSVPLAQGSLSDFYNQPSSGGGPSLSWTDKNTQAPKPIGTSYTGVVARDVTSADVQQQTDFRTQQPLFYRDGRPKFAMKVPLKLNPSQEFPEGEASWFVKGQAKDELQRAMSAAGADGAPKAGAVITVTLVQRRPSGQGMNPANIVQVTYQPAQGGQASTEAPSPVAVPQSAPAEHQVAPQMGQPAPQYVQQPTQQPAQQYAPQGQPVAQGYPQQGQAPVQQYAPQQVPQQAAPAQQGQAPAQGQAGQPLALPQNMTPEQQALFAQITGQPALAGQ